MPDILELYCKSMFGSYIIYGTFMYPHAIDRLRVLQFIFGRLREPVAQAELSKLTGLAQPTISSLQHLVRDGEIKLTRNTRKNLIGVACHGLRLPHQDVDALAWLLDGKPLDKGEVGRFVKQDSDAIVYGDDQLFQKAVLGLLAKSVKTSNPNAKVKMRFDSNVTARLSELEEFLEYERQPGQRLFASTIPSSLVHPPSAFDSGELVSPIVRGSGEEPTFQQLHAQRRETFLHNLKIFGERSIHSKSSLSRYARISDGHFLPLEKRHRQIENWIKLLETHPNYEVGLTDEEPLLELGVKTTPVALIRGVSQSRTRTSPIWGVHHIFWTDEDSVFSFVLSFEHAWMNLPREARDKDSVIAFLRDLLPPKG